MNKQQLASKIWASANKMRSKIEANEYKDYILGFIFYKFLSDKEVDYLKSMDWTLEDMKTDLTEEDAETVDACQKKLGYFIAYKDLFSTWINPREDFSVGNVRDALTRFARLINPHHEKVYKGIFDTLQNGLSKLGESAGAQTKAIRDLLNLIKDIPTSGRQDYDVLGFIYEYLISNFAANAGKKAGEFYTPHEVAVMMSEIVAHHLKGAEEITIYDPTSGSGSLLLNIGRSVSKYMADKNKINYFAQELKEPTYNLTRMNLVMRGILPDNITVRNGDTLEEDWPWFDETDPNSTYSPLYCDAVVSNPPYSQEWNPTENSCNDERYKHYGVAPKGTADYAFLLHDLFHVKPGGIMTIVLPHGVLFRGGEEEKIRRNLVERNNIDAIIGLPANIFFGTGIPTLVMVLKQKRTNDDVLIVDASRGFAKEGKNNKLRARDIRKIVDAVTERRNIPHFSRLVTRDEIRANDYNLNIPRYVSSADAEEQWDIYSTMFGGIPNSEIDTLSAYWDEFPSLRGDLFEPTSSAYSKIKTEDVKDTILRNTEVRRFASAYGRALADLPENLHTRLIDKLETVNPTTEFESIATELFKIYAEFSLIDGYAAYQLLDDAWQSIIGDIEILQAEGLSAANAVDYKMAIKKVNGKDVEVEDGKVGRIIPIALVEQEMLSEELENVYKLRSEVEQTSGRISEIIESLPEAEGETPWLKEDGSAFIPKELKAKVKKIKAEQPKWPEDSTEGLLLEADHLLDLEKKQKKEVKIAEEELLLTAISTIENLREDQIRELLHAKWITPLDDSFKKLANVVILENLVGSVSALSKKYAETLTDIDNAISASEEDVAMMISELTGNEFDMAGLSELQKLLRHE